MNGREGPEVSWKAIEENAEVVAADGEVVGRVTRIVGDSDADIFTGLAVAIDALGADRFVPSERVVDIRPERVDVDIRAGDVDGLPEYEETPTVRWRPGSRIGWRLRRLLRR